MLGPRLARMRDPDDHFFEILLVAIILMAFLLLIRNFIEDSLPTKIRSEVYYKKAVYYVDHNRGPEAGWYAKNAAELNPLNLKAADLWRELQKYEKYQVYSKEKPKASVQPDFARRRSYR